LRTKELGDTCRKLDEGVIDEKPVGARQVPDEDRSNPQGTTLAAARRAAELTRRAAL
jgi:hypothetical protein